MPTIKQKKVAKLIMENATLDKPLNGGQMLAKVSYSKGLQKQPSRILESQGVQDALEEYGFTEDNAKRVVTEIMMNSEADNSSRLKATDQVFKIHGSYAPEKRESRNLNVEVKLEDKDLDDIRNKYEGELKSKLSNENSQ